MPGFIEGHGHYMSLGRSKQILDLNDVDGWEEIVSKVAVAVDKSKPGEWIFGRGWHQDKWNSVPEDAVEGVPVNDTLSKVSPENPVVLGHASGHAAFWNDAALEIAGVNDETLDPEGGTIVRDKSGKATGLMRETAQRLISKARNEYDGRLTPQQIVKSSVEEDVHIIGLSILSGSHIQLVGEIMSELKKNKIDNIPLIVGGIIPIEDEKILKSQGVTAVYTPKDYQLKDIMADIVSIVEKNIS